MAANPPPPPGTNDPVFRKQFRFRKVLKKVSDGMGAEHLRAMKNLCYDVIPEKTREELDSGTTLFNILIEQNLINAEDVVFLCELLDEIGRKDLTDAVKKYSLDQDIPQKDSPYIYTLDIHSMKTIAEEVGRDWKMLARHLGLDETSIQSIHQANFGDLQEAALQALLRWQSKAGEKATPRALKRALTDMKLMSIVHKHFEGV